VASEFVRVRGWPEGRQSVEMFPVPAGRLKVAVPVFKVKLERFAPEIGMERGLVPGSALMMAASTTPHIVLVVGGSQPQGRTQPGITHIGCSILVCFSKFLVVS